MDVRSIGTFGDERIQTLKYCAVYCNLIGVIVDVYGLLAGRS